MALQMNYALRPGIELKALYSGYSTMRKETEEIVNNAYIKVISQSGDKYNVSYILGVYKEKDGALLTTEEYTFIPSVADDSPNFIKQCYEHAKTLEKYVNAIDC